MKNIISKINIRQLKKFVVNKEAMIFSIIYTGTRKVVFKQSNYQLNILSLILMVVLTITGCSTTRILPDKPQTGNLTEKPERLASQISLPIEIDISSVETLINQKLPKGQIAGENRRVSNTTSYSYRVFRNKPVKFTAQGNELIFKVPIDITARGSYTLCAGFWRDGDCCSTPNPFGDGCATPGIRTTEHGDASPTVDVELRIKLELQEDYSIKAKTYLKGALTGDNHLHIDLIGDLIRININIKDKLEKPLQKFVQDYQKEIDIMVAQLAQQYNIKKEISKYWEDIKKPIQMGELWLDVQPEKVIFENLNAKNDKLRIAVGFASKLQVVTTKPNPSAKPLPGLTLQQGTKGEFNIYLPGNTSFEFLENKAKQEVIGKKYEKDGVLVKIKDVDIKGIKLSNTNLLLLKATIMGKAKFVRFKGDIYFTALPNIDDENKIVSIEDFKIESQTNRFLINKGLPFLIDNFYYDELKNNLRYSYKSDYDKYFKLINDELKEVIIEDLRVKGELNELKVPGFYIDTENLELLLIANGTLNSTIEIK